MHQPGAKSQKAYEFAVDVAAGPPDSMFRWGLGLGLGEMLGGASLSLWRSPAS